MKRTCLIVYASMTGNTEEIANLIREGILQAGAAVDQKDILEVDVTELSNSYEHRGRAVDLLLTKLSELGADIVLDGLKIDMAPTSAEKEQCIQFGRSFVENSF